LHLAEMTVDIALENIKKNIQKPVHELKVLDPACGSGVFLVSLFGRMAESLRHEGDYNGKRRNIKWVRKLLPKLNQLYGIDISQTACHITCFSLYLALLEQLEPSDVEYLRKHNEKLPPLLAGTRSDSWNTVHQGNLFDPQLSFEEKDFDLVIGNPPWVSRGKQKDKDFLNWIKDNPNILGPDKQIAHGFMWKSPGYLSTSGIGCLLLPAAVLLNDHANQFQEAWLKSVTVDRVVNFSDLRFILFSGAVHPCVAIRFKPLASEPENLILYESPKADIRSQRGGPVYIREEDTTNLRLKDVLNGAHKGIAPIIWKSHYWGSWRDQRLLSRLNDLPKLHDLTGKIRKKGKRWNKSLGIELGNQENDGWWDKTYLYIKNTNNISLAIASQDCQTVEDASIPYKAERPRKKGLFEGPKVLISRGSKDMKVAFCDFNVLFQNSLHLITGKKEDANLLRFLNAVIKSDVAEYYLFHTSASWGTERDIVVFHELLSLPFFLPEDAVDPNRAQKIVDKVARITEEFERQLETGNWFGEERKRKEKTKRIREKLEPLLREYYDIDEYEAMLIEGTLQLAIKSFHPRQSTKKIPTLRGVSKEACQTYTKTLCEMLNNFGQGSSFRVNGEVIKGRPYSVVCVSLTEAIRRNVPVKVGNEKLAGIFERMEPLLQHKRGRFVFCQNLKVFDGNDLYILKPMQMRFWSRTAALNDADEVAGAILDSRGTK